MFRIREEPLCYSSSLTQEVEKCTDCRFKELQEDLARKDKLYDVELENTKQGIRGLDSTVIMPSKEVQELI